MNRLVNILSKNKKNASAASIPSDRNIAIVGCAGCGKSTMLINRFLSTKTNGSISVFIGFIDAEIKAKIKEYENTNEEILYVNDDQIQSTKEIIDYILEKQSSPTLIFLNSTDQGERFAKRITTFINKLLLSSHYDFSLYIDECDNLITSRDMRNILRIVNIHVEVTYQTIKEYMSSDYMINYFDYVRFHCVPSLSIAESFNEKCEVLKVGEVALSNRFNNNKPFETIFNI